MTAKNGKKTTEGFNKQKGKGRPKGVPNKTTAAIKDMIVKALDKKGGVAYLEKQADENPVAFMGLVGKVIPLQVDGNINHKFKGLKVRIVKSGD